MKVLRYGHLRSAPVVVDATYTHGAGTAYTPCILVGLHAPCTGASFMAYCLSATTDGKTKCSCQVPDGAPAQNYDPLR